MYKKQCPRCHRPSFSSSEGTWMCPICHEDLTSFSVLPIHNKKPKSEVVSIYDQTMNGTPHREI